MDTASIPTSVFISYATPDRARAFEICKHLESVGHACWIAPRNIRTGHDYGEEIIHGIEQSRCFVLILSSAANKSIYVKREVERAVSKAKPVFPVRLEDVMPSPSLELHLASLHYLDAWHGVLRDHILTLAHTLSGEPDDGQAPTLGDPPERWWRRPYIIATGAACVVALALLIGWLKPPSTTGKGDSAALPTTAIVETSKPIPRAMLSHCAAANMGPVIRCQGAAVDSRIHIRTPEGKEVIIPGGSGADSFSSGGIYSSSTFLPWVGPGASARVEPVSGVFSAEQPLPDIPNMAIAINVASSDDQAPPLFYVVNQDRRNAIWAYAFFAPMNTTDIEWSNDSAGFLRISKSSIPGGLGPFLFDDPGQGNTKLAIRWRNSSGAWSGPAYYDHADIETARLASVKPLQDLASSIGCYRSNEPPPIPTHVRCRTVANLPLGELFDDLRWGTTANKLQPVDGFNFTQWASAILAPKDKEVRDERMVMLRIQYDANFFGPWRKVKREDPPSNFFATLPTDGDLYFEARPRGGGEPLTARIKAANQEPR